MVENAVAQTQPAAGDDITEERLRSILDEITVAPSVQRLDRDMLDNIRESIELHSQIRRAVVGGTTSGHWEDFGGKPWLNSAGAQVVARLFGLSISPPKFVYPEASGAVQVEATVTVSRDGMTFTDHGSDDEFSEFNIKTKKKRWVDQGATADQIKGMVLTEVKKNAYAHAQARAVQGWVGLRGLSWPDLESLGFHRDPSRAVTFRKGATPGGKIKTISIAEANKLPQGSRFNVSGEVERGGQRSVTGGKVICDLFIKDATSGMKVQFWGNKPDWLKSGELVFCSEVKVGDFRGNKQYTAEKIERAESEPVASPEEQPPAEGKEAAQQ